MSQKRFKYGEAYGDNRCCGFPTKSGRPCKAHAQMAGEGEIIGCYLHDPRRELNGPGLLRRRQSERQRSS